MNRPIAIPSTALAIASRTTAHTGPTTSRSSSPNATAETTEAWIAAMSANASGVAASRSSLANGIVSSRSSVPVVRSRSIAIEVTRNIEISGKMPSNGAADALEDKAVLEDELSSMTSSARNDEEQRDRPRVVPELEQNAAAPWQAWRAGSRAFPSASAQERRLELLVRPSASRSSAGVSAASEPAVAQQQQVVAARRLVHYVARDEERRPAGRELTERAARGLAGEQGRGRRSARRGRARAARRAALWRARRVHAGHPKASARADRARRPRSTVSIDLLDPRRRAPSTRAK